MSDQIKPTGSTSALLGDLESIRSLLSEQQLAEQAAGPPPDVEPAAEAEADASQDDEVPLLEDVVQGGVSLNEAFLSGEGDFGAPDTDSRLPDNLFTALLSDEWRESAGQLVDDAGVDPDGAAAVLASNRLDTLNEALRLRIDEVLERWLRAALLSGIDELRRDLLEAIREELGATVAARFNETSPEEDPDGA